MMRITTQMLNNTANKGGIMLTGKSLLDYVNQGNSPMAGGLLGALDKAGSIADPVKKSNYEKMKKILFLIRRKKAKIIKKFMMP